MLTVACVLRSGGDYDARYVGRLWRGVASHLSIPHEFVCLTDLPFGPVEMETLTPHGERAKIRVEALQHDWPGWWSKLETMRLPGPLLYFDLDTVIVGDITPLADAIMDGLGGKEKIDVTTVEDSMKVPFERKYIDGFKIDGLLGIRDFYNGSWQSGILGWGCNMGMIYERFEHEVATAEWSSGRNGVTARIGGLRLLGDATWIRDAARRSHIPMVLANDLLPGVYSAKADIHAKHGGKLPADARIVAFHGRPRPHELIPAPAWLREHWGAAA